MPSGRGLRLSLKWIAFRLCSGAELANMVKQKLLLLHVYILFVQFSNRHFILARRVVTV